MGHPTYHLSFEPRNLTAEIETKAKFLAQRLYNRPSSQAWDMTPIEDRMLSKRADSLEFIKAYGLISRKSDAEIRGLYDHENNELSREAATYSIMLKTADIQFWQQKDYWYLHEALALWSGINPDPRLPVWSETNNGLHERATEIKLKLDLICRAGTLISMPDCQTRSEEFVRWSLSKRVVSPFIVEQNERNTPSIETELKRLRKEVGDLKSDVERPHHKRVLAVLGAILVSDPKFKVDPRRRKMRRHIIKVAKAYSDTLDTCNGKSSEEKAIDRVITNALKHVSIVPREVT